MSTYHLFIFLDIDHKYHYETADFERMIIFRSVCTHRSWHASCTRSSVAVKTRRWARQRSWPS